MWQKLNPEFQYGDERDKIQRQNSIKAKKLLDRDEAWATRAAKRRAREEAQASRRLAKENKNKTPLDRAAELPKKALARAASLRSSPSMSVKTSPAPARSSPPAKVMGIRLDTSQKSLRPPGVGSSRTVYAVPSPIRPMGRGGHSKPGMPARPTRPPVSRSRPAVTPVRATPKPASKPPVTRAATQPTPKPKPTVKVAPTTRTIPSRAQTTPVVASRRKP